MTGYLHPSRAWFVLFIAAAAFITMAPCAAYAKRCTGTCGDASTFDKPASTGDACRVMVCPRTCRLAGVTSCLWCGQTAGAQAQPAQFQATIRFGPDPNNPGAPTGPVQGTGQGTIVPGGASEPGGGTVRIETEMIQLDLVGSSPLFGPVQIHRRPSPLSRGHMDHIPLGPDQYRIDTYFDLFLDIQGSGPVLHNNSPLRVRAILEPHHPVQGDNVGSASVTWAIENAPVALYNPTNQLQGWILGGTLTLQFQTPPQPPNLVDAFPVEHHRLRLAFDTNLDLATAQDPNRYTLGSSGLGSHVLTANVIAGANSIVELDIVSVLPHGQIESITASGIGSAACPSCLSPPQTRDFINGVLSISQLQSPDPSHLGQPCVDRSRYAGAGNTLGPRVSFRGVAVQTYGAVAYFADQTGGQRSGIAVTDLPGAIVNGQRYLLVGRVRESGTETEVANVVHAVDEGPGPPVVPQLQTIPVLRNEACDATQSLTNGEDYEGVVVTVDNAKVLPFPNPPRDPVPGGPFLIGTPMDAPTDTILVSNLGGHYTFDADTTFVVEVTGVLHHDVDIGFCLLPRDQQDPKKKPLQAPDYDESKWNDGPGDPPKPNKNQAGNNCYRYAVDKHTQEGGSARPGQKGGNPPPRGGTARNQNANYNCAEFKKALEADGLKETHKDSACVNGYKIALVVGLSDFGDPEGVREDYHFYRQDSNGKWSHKPGGKPATNRDARGKEITNPENADHGKARDSTAQYKKAFCGYFCVTKATEVAAWTPRIDSEIRSRPGEWGSDGTEGGTSPGGSLRYLTGSITAKSLASSGEDDTTIVYTSDADLDTLTEMLTGLTPVPDPAWESRLGYGGFALRVDSVPTLGSRRVRIWNGVIQMDVDTTRTWYADSKGLEDWLLIEMFGEVLSAPDPNVRDLHFLRIEPNPFASAARIRYYLGTAGTIAIEIHDVSGRAVARPVDKRFESAGFHEVALDGRGMKPGVYWCRLRVDGRIARSKMIVLP